MNSQILKYINICCLFVIGAGIYGEQLVVAGNIPSKYKTRKVLSEEKNNSEGTSSSSSSSDSHSRLNSVASAIVKAHSKADEGKNPTPFKPSSYYLEESKEHIKKIENDYDSAHSDGRLEQYKLGDDIVKLCAYYLEPGVECEGVSWKNMSDTHKQSLLFLAELDRQFVKVPAGDLPARYSKTPKIHMNAFETTRYPVTRALWNEVMGNMPAHVPQNERATWDQCPDCPMTYVAYEDNEYEKDANGEYRVNEFGNRIKAKDEHGRDRIIAAEIQTFLKKLNERAQDTGCTYHLPSFNQQRYSIRADVTGNNRDKYSKGVTDTNANEYVIYWDNSNHQIQSVGQKKLNAFGIEFGNVWKISSDLIDKMDPRRGRAVCSGDWIRVIPNGLSVLLDTTLVGYRFPHVGFDLVRHCQ